MPSLNVLVPVFQSTPPRRRRHVLLLYAFPNILVSIHAPAKEATIALNSLFEFTLRFNPRPREGGDLGPIGKAAALARFQSTPPRRRRRFRL